MRPIKWHDDVPVLWSIDHLPDVDDVRPPACTRCGEPARRGGRIRLHGHGVRTRQVVVPPCMRGQPIGLTECWSRRYQCQACGAVPTVLPAGVLPRFLYSAVAMVMAFVLVTTQPVGEGLSHATAYDRQGMNRVRVWRLRTVDYRWRSIDRWRARIPAWWPAASDAEGLLVTLLGRAGCRDRERLMAATIRSHVRWGAAM